MIITKDKGKETIYTFLDTGNRILRANYNKMGISKRDIIDTAATLIEDEIRLMTFDGSKYPNFSELTDSDSVPPLLLQLLSGIIKSKSKVQYIAERRRIAISHSIIQAVRPRFFISQIHLAIAVYVNTKLESRELVDILSSLSFSDDYRELMRLQDSLIPTTQDSFQLVGDLTNFIFDNTDVNMRTLTGHDTWHALGGLACTPDSHENRNFQPDIPRDTTPRSALEHGQFSQIPIKTYKKKSGTGWKSCFARPIKEPTPSSLILFTKLDILWLSSFCLLRSLGAKCYNWSGFMQSVVTGSVGAKSQITILPFINLDPSEPETLYSALCFVQSLVENRTNDYRESTPVKFHATVTFDQPLYAKADDIVEASSELDRIIVRLGGFHLAMSYMGAIGFIMKGSGIDDLWGTVYAPNSIEHMLSGHAYARALRFHLLTSAALTSRITQLSTAAASINLNHLFDVYRSLSEREPHTPNLLQEDDLQEVSNALEAICKDLSTKSRTAKLWINYLMLTHILRTFIYAERTSNWELHLYAIVKMIPIFHASGHLAYARSARRYVEAMFTLPEIMDPHQYHKLTAEGLFTVRRSNNSWSGNFTDQTIEQELMRLIKAPGGLAHGRGTTPSTQTKLVHVLPKCIPVFRALKNFCEVHTHTSDQYFDLRDSSSVRDSKDYETYLRWLESHCPFGFENVDGLVSISTGVVAAKNANADEAFTIGQVAADAISGTNYAEMKLRRKDRVVSICMSHNAGTVCGQQVELNPTLLFMRVTCVITDRAEMEKNLEFEFSKQPTALFEKGVMRKGVKSTLAHILQQHATVVTSAPSGSHFVIDGGYLLHLVLWPKDCTYAGVCNNYVEFVLKLFGQDTPVVFGGYTDTSINTKTCEQDRRASRTTSPDIIVGLDTDVTVKQAAFLNNRKNKAQFIHLLKDIFEQKHITCFQSDGDADYLICQTAMTKALTKQPVVLVGNDTDRLVILIHSVTKDLNISMQTSTKPNTVYSIAEIQSALSDDVKSNILLAHAIIGCDTISALYNIGKQKVISVLQNTNNDFTVTVLNVFKERNASHHQIASAGEHLMLKLYGAKKQNLWTR